MENIADSESAQSNGKTWPKPNWAHWRQIALVSFEQALALSVDVDPEVLADGFFPIEHVEMWRRHGVALNHMDAGTLAHRRGQVSLVAFASWAEGIGLTLPEAFPRPARRDDAAAATAHGPWPWGSHETKLLRELKAAAQELWTKYDPMLPATAPTSEEVTAWLIGRGVSKRVAEVMAQILRADDLRPGPHTND